MASGDQNVADVLIIGGGASGGVVAKHLTDAGVRVVCLEQGDHVDPSEFAGDKPEWELVSKKRWHPNPNRRDIETDYPTDVRDSDVEPMMYCGVGGSTLLYTAMWMRFLPSDFRVKTLDGVADDWPITYEDLVPYYNILDEELGLAGLAGDPAYPPGQRMIMPPHPIGKVGMKAVKGMDQLGWHWWPGSNTIPTEPYRGRNECVRYGTCSTGCPQRAKSSFDQTHWTFAIKNGAKLITRARVKEITVNDSGLATGAVYIDRNGRERRQKANVVIMCASSIGTPRILLMSESGKFPNGLGNNSSGLLGKNLMMHPFSAVAAYSEEPLESWLGPAGHTIYSLQFYETDKSRGFVRGAKWGITPVAGPFSLRGGQDNDPIINAWDDGIHSVFDQTVGKVFEWGVIAEDLPEEHNRVTLSDELTDSDGLPAPKINYKTSENTRKLLDWHIERVIEAIEASGCTGYTVSNPVRECGWHLSGTARMGTDPERSVVNEFGVSHDVENLLVCDGSVFVTCSGLHPTATITASALRSVDNLLQNRYNQRVPL